MKTFLSGLAYSEKQREMKVLTVLLISRAAFACTEVPAHPAQTLNNNIGDITDVD